MISEGQATKEIAFHLGLSAKAVETRRVNPMGKLAANNVADLTRIAVRAGIDHTVEREDDRACGDGRCSKTARLLRWAALREARV